MKINIIPFLLISSFAFTQAKPQDYSDIKKHEELRKYCIDKDKEISRLTIENNSLKDEIKKKTSNNNASELNDLKELIKNINSVFLRDIFEDKYIKNDKYFTETDLALEKEDDTQKFRNSNTLINSVKIDEMDPFLKQICYKALDFNENYLKLFTIRKEVLFQKYDSEKVNHAIKEIDSLPVLENNSKLFFTKEKIKNYLENYFKRTCELKSALEDLIKNPFQTPTHKQKYDNLKNKYKAYPYLIQVIERVKNDVSNYSKNDLQPCEEVKENKTEAIKPEAIKPEALQESSPKKVE